MRLKMLSAKWRPFCLSLNVLICMLLVPRGLIHTWSCTENNMATWLKFNGKLNSLTFISNWMVWILKNGFFFIFKSCYFNSFRNQGPVDCLIAHGK